jgi:hypothetical protein
MKNLNQSCKVRKHKQLCITFILSFLFLIPLCSYSQTPVKAIEVTSTGNCNFGYDVNIAVGHDLYVGGNIVTTTSNLTIGCNNSSPDIYPAVNNTGRVGNSTLQFSEINAQYHYATGVLLTSDRRLKTNFRKIETPLEKILKMDGLKYDFISQDNNTLKSAYEKSASLKLEKNKFGFVAQDLENILPEAVFYNEEKDRYYIDYNAIIPVIVEAMKEQQVRIDNLEFEIRSLKSTSKIDATDGKNNGQPASLEQNIPNPFSETTSIAIFLPQSVGKAAVYVYNMQGIQIKSFAVNERGNTSLTIEGNTLNAGMYLYTLIADGKEIDTKKMILTK